MEYREYFKKQIAKDLWEYFSPNDNRTAEGR
jgi:hypothetical protein